MTKRAIHEDGIISERVKVAMKDTGCTQQALAVECGVSYQQLQKYIYGKDRISAGRLAVIANFLEKPIIFFYDGIVLE